MPTTAQPISAVVNKITPVQLIPEQDVLLVIPAKSATINWILAKLVPGTPEIPAVPGVVGRGKIVDDNGKVVSPAIQGSPDIPAVPAVPDSYITVEQGSFDMTQDEWDAWDSKEDDNDYRSAIAASRLGLTIVS